MLLKCPKNSVCLKIIPYQITITWPYCLYFVVQSSLFSILLPHNGLTTLSSFDVGFTLNVGLICIAAIDYREKEAHDFHKLSFNLLYPYHFFFEISILSLSLQLPLWEWILSIFFSSFHKFLRKQMKWRWYTFNKE